MADDYPKSPSDRPILMSRVQSYDSSPYQGQLQNYQPQYQLNVPGQLSLSALGDSIQNYQGEQEQGQGFVAFNGVEHHPLNEEERLQAEAEKRKLQSRERVRRFRDRKRKEKEELRAQRAQKAAQQGDLNVRIRRELVKEVVDKFVEVVEGRPPAVAREILQKFLAHPQVKATLRDGAAPSLFPNPYPATGKAGFPGSPESQKNRKRKQLSKEAEPQGLQQQQQQQHLQQQLQQPQLGGHLHHQQEGSSYALGLGGPLLLAPGLGTGATTQTGSVHL